MKPFIRAIEKQWTRVSGASATDISAAERRTGFPFPDDYKTFLAWSNGGEGPVGKEYVSLWPTSELPGLNGDYEIPTRLQRVLGIGTDGGGVCFGFDYRDRSSPRIIRVPLGDLSEGSMLVLGAGFGEWLEHLAS